jgi:hypothetical protein
VTAPDARLALLIAIATGAVIALLWYGPIPQSASYHAFADQRSLFGIPNFSNTLSNLPFFLVGVAGLVALRRGVPAGGLPPLRAAYLAFFLGAALLFPGSAWYHLAPSNHTLVWDRLPMTIAFMAFFAIILGEHVRPRLGARLLLPLLGVGVASVLAWWLSDNGTGGDLRLYVLVQYLPMLLIPVIVLTYPPALRPTGYVWALVAAYAIAKLLELLDGPVLSTTGMVSGHALKHLVAAAGMLVFLIGLFRRRASLLTLP